MKSFKIIVSDEAELNLREAIKWYNEQSKGLGNHFYKSIVKAFSSIKSNPLAFENRYLDFRTYPMKKFPFLIHYLVFEKEIIIINILHTSQNWNK